MGEGGGGGGGGEKGLYGILKMVHFSSPGSDLCGRFPYRARTRINTLLPRHIETHSAGTMIMKVKVMLDIGVGVGEYRTLQMVHSINSKLNYLKANRKLPKATKNVSIVVFLLDGIARFEQG